MTPLRPATYYLILINILIAVITASLVGCLRIPLQSNLRNQSATSNLHQLRQFIGYLIPIWVVGSVVNVIASGGLPIVWLIQGDTSRTYADFGLATFSGFIYATGQFIANAVLLDYVTTGNRRRLWLIPCVVGFQVLVVNRGGMVSAILELLGVYLIAGRITWTFFLRVGVVLAIVFISFGVIGDARVGEAGREALTSNMTDDAKTFFSEIPSAGWWAYLYGSVGTVNLNNSIEGIQPLGYPFWSAMGLFPSFVRIHIYDMSVYELRYPLEMVNPVFNVFTLYGSYLADFGIAGCFAITSLLMTLASYCYRCARRAHIWAILAYSVCFQIIILSVFWDNFLGWVSLFQIALAVGFKFQNDCFKHSGPRDLAVTAADRPT